MPKVTKDFMSKGVTISDLEEPTARATSSLSSMLVLRLSAEGFYFFSMVLPIILKFMSLFTYYLIHCRFFHVFIYFSLSRSVKHMDVLIAVQLPEKVTDSLDSQDVSLQQTQNA